MKILFLNANLYGHINPTLGIVRKFSERGHSVSYFCAEPFAEYVKEAGAEWVGYGSRLDRFFREYRPTDRHPFFMLMEYMLLYDEAALPDMMNIINEQDYDLIICDSYFGAACFIKQMVNIPVVCSHSSFAMSRTPVPDRMLAEGFHPQLDNCYRVLRRISGFWKVCEPTISDVFISRGDLNIAYTTPRFNGDENIHEPDYLFAGAVQFTAQENKEILQRKAGKKLIYISLGSVNTDFVDFYKMCISAFRDTAYIVYMSIGRKNKVSELGEIPDNFVVDNFLPQRELLNYADAFITHAGFNSVNEAIYAGVPMLALPLVNDQMMTAKRIAELVLGLSEDMKTLTADKLIEKTELLLADDKFKDNCMALSAEIKDAAGLERAVSKIEEFVGERKAERCH